MHQRILSKGSSQQRTQRTALAAHIAHHYNDVLVDTSGEAGVEDAERKNEGVKGNQTKRSGEWKQRSHRPGSVKRKRQSPIRSSTTINVNLSINSMALRGEMSSRGR